VKAAALLLGERNTHRVGNCPHAIIAAKAFVEIAGGVSILPSEQAAAQSAMRRGRTGGT